MTTPERPRLVRFERRAMMDWIVYRRRMLVAVLAAVALAFGAGVRILYAVGVEHLNKHQLRHFAHQRRLYPRGLEGPIFERVPPE